MTDGILEQKWHYFFSVLDTDRNGVLQPSDFLLVADRISDLITFNHADQKTNLSSRSYRLFIQITTDIGKEETTLTRNEWIQFFNKIVLSRPSRYIATTARYIFSLFDQDGDGYISREEYLDMIRAYGLNLDEIEDNFALLDLDDDGYISKYEMIQAFEAFFLSNNRTDPGNWIYGDWKEIYIN